VGGKGAPIELHQTTGLAIHLFRLLKEIDGYYLWIKTIPISESIITIPLHMSRRVEESSPAFFVHDRKKSNLVTFFTDAFF
jgi:hypothetical protein